MVNSESMDSPGDGKAKDCVTQLNSVSVGSLSPSPVTASTLCLRKMDFSNETGDITNSDSMDALPETAAIAGNEEDEEDDEEERTRLSSTTEKVSSLYCSVPLNKVRDVLNTYAANPNGQAYDATKTKKLSRKLLCLYCDRTFVTTNLRQKHVVRCHSVRQARRSSSRFQQPQSTTACIFCNKLNNVEHNLKQLFKHLVEEHSSKYFACLNCEERFLFKSHLEEHNLEIHNIKIPEVPDVGEDKAKNSRTAEEGKPKLNGAIIFHDLYDAESSENQDKEKTNLIKSKHKTKIKKMTRKNDTVTNRPNLRMGVRKELRKKKVGVKSTKAGVKRNTRLQAKITQSKTTKKRPKSKNEKLATKAETNDKSSSSINPYPTFDAYFRVKKITDHSIDNLKISSLTFDDVFDKAFYNRIKCNIQENLQNHIDGKLFKNEESESRISNFEKMQEINNSPSENFGCDISLNAATPVVSLLSTQFGEDLESQIEYGSKASKKKPPPKKDEIHYKYFTRRKYQASILESKENRDLSKLDMWTQLIVKNRQQNIINEKKSDKEKLEYTKGNEYRTKMQNEELDRILDRRGPFEDLKEEANKKAAQEKLNRLSEDVNCEAISDVSFIINDILEGVFDMYSDEIKTEAVSTGFEKLADVSHCNSDKDCEVPFYLKLRRASSADEPDIDKSDRITLICSSQETENFEESNVPRDKNSLVELTGEWARARIYICAACGIKVPNIKMLIDHKSLFHQNTWVQHYEFVGNQSELYKHLSIPGLGKVGYVEEFPMSKTWERSGARMCTKCSKTCNSLSELHRHILECGEDWSWMLARRKLKYRPFGAKSRRKRRGLVKRIINKEKAIGEEVREKKKYNIKRIDGPRQKPSDAETIQRMLANLPAKRATRKLISLKDGFPRTIKRKPHTPNASETSIKSKSKLIAKKNKKSLQSREQLIQTTNKKKGVKCNPIMLRKSVRNINKVFGTKLLDTNSTLLVKRKLKNVFQHQRITRSKNLSNNVAAVGTAIKTKTGKQSFMNKVKMLSKAVTKGVLKNKAVKSTEIKSSDENDSVVKSKRPSRKLQTSSKKPDEDSTLNTKETVLESIKLDPKVSKIDETVETAEKKEWKNPEINGQLETNKKESIGSKFFRTLSLRRLKKPKSEIETLRSDPGHHKEINSKVKTKNGKRKSALSFRNAFKKIKLKDRKIANIVQVDGSSQISDEIPKILPFLENIHINDQDDAIDNEIEAATKVCDKAVMNGAREFVKSSTPATPNTPATITEITPTDDILTNIVIKQEVESLENQDGINLISNVGPSKLETAKVANKAKIKKRVKGLNDCIAMLTSKLQQKVEDKVLTQPFEPQQKEDVTTNISLENEPKQLFAVSEITSSASDANLQHIQPPNEVILANECENILNNCEDNLTISESKQQELHTNFIPSDCVSVTNSHNSAEVTEEDVTTNDVGTNIEEAAQTSKIYEILSDVIEPTHIIENNDKLCTNNEKTYVESLNIESDNNCKSKPEVKNNLEEINNLIFESANLKLLETSLNISEIKLHENHGLRQNLATLKFEEIVSQNDLAILMDKFNDVDIIKNKFKEVDVNIEIDIMKCLENVTENVITIDKQKQFKKRVKSNLKRKQNQRINPVRKFNHKTKENIDIVTNEDCDVKCMVNESQIENDLAAVLIENGEIVLDNEYLNDNEVNCEVDATQKDDICIENNVNEYLLDKQVNLNDDITNKCDDNHEINGNPQGINGSPQGINGNSQTNESSPLVSDNHLNSIIDLPKIDAKTQHNKPIKKKGKKKKQSSTIENIKSVLIEDQEPDILENKFINTESSEKTPIKHHIEEIEDPLINKDVLQKSETDSEDEVPLASLIKTNDFTAPPLASPIKTNDFTAPVDLVEETIENVVINYVVDDLIVENKTVEKKKKNLVKKRKSSLEKKHILLLEEAIDSDILNTEIDDFENLTQCKSKLKISCKIFQKKNKTTNNKKSQSKKPENIEEQTDVQKSEEKVDDDVQKFEESEKSESIVNEVPFEGVLVIKQETLQIPKEVVPDNDMVTSLELEIRRRIQLSNQLLQLQSEEKTEEIIQEPEQPEQDDKVAKLCKELEETVENISNLKIVNSEDDEDIDPLQEINSYEEFQIDNEQDSGTNKMKLCRKKAIFNGEEKRKVKKNQRKHTNNIKKKSRVTKPTVEETILQTNLIDPATVEINMMDRYEDVNMEIEDFQIDSPIQIGRGGQICATVYKTLNKEENIFEIQNAEIGRKLTINKKKIFKPDFQEQHDMQSQDLRNNFMLDLGYQQNIEDIGKICFDFENIVEQNEIEMEKQLESIAAAQHGNVELNAESPTYLHEAKLQKKKSKKSKNKVDVEPLTIENDCQNYSNLKITIDLSDINNISAFNTSQELTKVKKKKRHTLSLDIDSHTPIKDIDIEIPNTENTFDLGNLDSDLLNVENNLEIPNGVSDLDISKDINQDEPIDIFITDTSENKPAETDDIQPSFVIPVHNEKIKKVKKNRKQKCVQSDNKEIVQNLSQSIDEEKCANLLELNESKIPDSTNIIRKSTTKTKGARKSDKKKRSTDQTQNPGQLYCEICDRYFARCDNLLKHKRTLTHIAKLSEIEAKEAAAKNIIVEQEHDAYKMNINISDILNKPEKEPEHDVNNDIANKIHVNSPFMLKTNSDTLKLADIINDVLNKPVNDETIKQTFCESSALPNPIVKETKRYKSLGERKSFESDLNTTYTFNNRNDEMSTPKLSNTDSILKHQISMLENIIENQGPFGYIDDLSISSNKSMERLSGNSELSVLSETKQDNLNQINFTHTTNIINSLIKPAIHGDNFLKPTQYEEISNDSSSVRNNFDDQRSRKVLNRDEELFLECCSLLKSSSEVSSYSKRSSKTISVLNNFEIMKPSDEPDWMEGKRFAAKNQEFRNGIYSNSCPNTPLGDGFGDNYSNTNSDTITTDWNNKQPNFTENPAFEDISEDSKDSALSTQKGTEINQIQHNENNFRDVFGADINKSVDDDEHENMNENDIIAEQETFKEVDEDLKKKMVSRFDGLMAKALKNSLQVVTKSKNKKKQFPEVTQTSITDYAVALNPNKTEADIYDSKKMLTKGAMKVFEGLKVSIPTDDLDIKELLNGTFGPGNELKNQLDPIIIIEEPTPTPTPTPEQNEPRPPKSTLKKFGNKLGLKVTKKIKPNLKDKDEECEYKKSHDVYDFEETQDNTDIFNSATFTNLTAFRNQIAEKKSTNEPAAISTTAIESDSESNRFIESFNFEAQSVSSFSTESTISLKKPKQKNITKNKCMIMGRIFKNAFKSKIEDDIRDIPTVENTKLVEDYVKQLPEKEAKKNKMSEQEMNLLFDKLLQEKDASIALEKEKQKIEEVKIMNGKTAPKPRKAPIKRKRPRHNSESTDDEFNLNKTRKRYTKKKHKNVDDTINLEQELKECIGVASRKSQRKCTSGKQNVLVEFWSSDESVFEAMLLEDVVVKPPVINIIEEIVPIIEPPCNEPTLQPEIEIEMTAPPSEVEKPKATKIEKTAGVRRKSTVKHNRNRNNDDKEDRKLKHIKVTAETLAANRRKRAAADTLYYWSSSSEDESQDLIEIKPIRDEVDEDDDRPMQHGWIVGDSPKKLVTMLAQAKGKKVDAECVKEQGKKRTTM